jgi:hypothetical protein
LAGAASSFGGDGSVIVVSVSPSVSKKLLAVDFFGLPAADFLRLVLESILRNRLAEIYG